jgi:hypothetical protein
MRKRQLRVSEADATRTRSGAERLQFLSPAPEIKFLTRCECGVTVACKASNLLVPVQIWSFALIVLKIIN